MKKIILAIVVVILIGILVYIFLPKTNTDIPSNVPEENILTQNEVHEEEEEEEDNSLQPSLVKAEYMDDIFGIYGISNNTYISILPGKDDNHIDVSYFAIRAENFTIKDFPITKSNDGLINGKMTISNNVDGSELLEGAEADLSIENGIVKVSFNKNVLMFPQDASRNTMLEFEKVSEPILLEGTKEKALAEIEESQGKAVNEEIFTVVSNTDNYLILKCERYLYSEDGYYREGNSISDLTKYYSYSKKDNKFVTLEDIAGSKMNDVNDYIKSEIEKMKSEWKKGKFNGEDIENNTEPWPYSEFEGIGKTTYLENYFLIDELNQIVRVRVLGYPDEARKALGDICVDVPFSCFEKVI